MPLDARPHIQDARSTDVDGSHRACCDARLDASRSDDETTVLRLAGDRDLRAPQACDDEVTVLRIARRARQHS